MKRLLIYNNKKQMGGNAYAVSKKMPRSCRYCTHGVCVDGLQIVCSKKALLQEDISCRRFRYDPLKRVPPRRKALDFSKYDQEDFSL